MPPTLRRQPAVETALTRVAAMSRKGGRTRRPAGPMVVFLAQAADACAGSIEIRGLGSRVWPLTCELIGRRLLGRRSACLGSRSESGRWRLCSYRRGEHTRAWASRTMTPIVSRSSRMVVMTSWNFLAIAGIRQPALTIGLFMPDDVVMAMKTLIVDDLDGSDGASTVSFSLGNTAYEIDMSKKNKD